MARVSNQDVELQPLREGASSPVSFYSANLLSRLTFWYFNAVVKRGKKKPLENEDLPEVDHADLTQRWGERLQAAWDEEAVKEKPSLFKALNKIYGKAFWLAGAYKVPHDVLTFLGPFFLQRILATIQQDEDGEGAFSKTNSALWFVFGLFISELVKSLFLHQYFHRVYLVSIHLRSGVVSLIYNKALKLSNESRQSSTVGEIVNLMAMLMDMTPYLHNLLWSAELQIVVAMGYLVSLLGPSVLVGFLVLLVIVPLNAVIMTRLRKWFMTIMKIKDKRVRFMNEFLQGIRSIKYYAWESAFMKRIIGARQEEISFAKKYQFVAAVQGVFWNTTPVLVALSSFATYAMVAKQTLTLEIVFPSLSLFNIMRFPMSVLPMMITSFITARVALRRLEKFVTLGELPEPKRYEKAESDWAIVIQNAAFAWEANKVVVSAEDVKIPKGKLTAIVGKVGAGKSSLLSAILGEMKTISGEAKTFGSIAYIPQQAWIRNASLQENITFQQDFDEDRYWRVVKASCLEADIRALPAEDHTEIGERGITLSGGQKQRISIARAVYNGADIYLFDDSLSAVDAHVGKDIFDRVLANGSGMLANETRVLVTHKIDVLPNCDNVIVIEGGKVVEQGSYRSLMGKDSLLKQLVQAHALEDDTDGNHSQSDNSGIESSIARRRSDRKSENEPVKKPVSKDKKLMTVEERQRGGVSWTVYKNYLKAVGFHGAFFSLFVLAAGQSVSIYTQYWLAHWAADSGNTSYDSNVTEGFDEATSNYLSVYGGLTAAQVLTTYVFYVVYYSATLRGARRLHNGMLASVSRGAMSFFDTTPLGRILNRFSKDVDVVDQTLPMQLMQYLNCIFAVIGVVVLITTSNPFFLIALAIISVLYVYVQRYYLKTALELKRLDSVARSPVYAHFSETLNGVSSIRAYGCAREFSQENAERLDRANKVYIPIVTAYRWLSIRLEFCGTIMITATALMGILSVNAESTQEQEALAALAISMALSITNTLSWSVRVSTEVESNMNAVERIKEYTELDSEAPHIIPDSRPPASWPAKGSIVLKNVSMKYRSDTPMVLKGLTFTIEGGEKIGVVGRTGAGKSSLMALLFRLVEPCDGSLLIDGVDVLDLGLFDLRSRLSIVQQDPSLFIGTVRFNLNPSAKLPDHKLWTALEQVGLKDAIKKLGGLDSNISEGGENLSVGERQLLCMARALLRNSKIIILDEATASVDYDTDKALQRTIRDGFGDCTVLTIAHRLNTIIDYDRVLVMSDGQVVEFDTPANLLKKRDGVFSALVKETGPATATWLINVANEAESKR